MTPTNHLNAINRARNAELMHRGGVDPASLGARRRGRALAALVLGATTVVGVADDAIAAVQLPVSTQEWEVPERFLPVVYRLSPDPADLAARALETARWRVDARTNPAPSVASLALEIGRLQRDIASRVVEGMEEWMGETYASLEAVRRAIGDALVDGEEAQVVEAALDRAGELLSSAA